MKEEWKVYIKGVQERGNEVIKALTNLGANNSIDCIGDNPQYLYYITHNGIVNYTFSYSEYGQIIMDNYHELHLLEQRNDGDWKDGDILIRKDRIEYIVFRKYSYNTMFYNYDFTISKDEHIWFSIAGEDHLYKAENFRLATSEEIKQFYSLLHKMNKDWDYDKKHLINLKSKPTLNIIIG